MTSNSKFFFTFMFLDHGDNSWGLGNISIKLEDLGMESITSDNIPIIQDYICKTQNKANVTIIFWKGID